MSSESGFVKAVFMNALDKAEPHERKAYLEAACGDDHILRERVEELLRAHEEPGSFLQEGVAAWKGDEVTPNRQPSFSRASSAGVSRLLGTVEPSRSPRMNWIAPR